MNWNRDITTLRRTHANSVLAFPHSADYACAIERGSRFWRLSEYVFGAVSIVGCVALIVWTLLAWAAQ